MKKLLILLFIVNLLNAQSAPVLTAVGNNAYCPLSFTAIVDSFTLSNPSNEVINTLYIQISNGYTQGEDILQYLGGNPLITANWNALDGKLTLTKSPTANLSELVAAIEDVFFNSSNPAFTGVKNFTISINPANYLPSTGHFYLYVPSIGINWTNAKNAAASSTFYGLQGYLATITTMEEALFAGAQTTGTGWIGGSDQASEGTWQWETGPEQGTVFWNGGVNGSSPTFAFWNTNEPNNQGDEDYTHITAPGVGIAGSWNDLKLNGDPNGNYQPKGYVVEYGGFPNEPVLQISATTALFKANIISTTSDSICNEGVLSLNATSSGNTVYWFDAPTGGNLLATGNVFTTPYLFSSTTYYASAYDANCTTAIRTAVEATIAQVETPIIDYNTTICEGSSATLTVTNNVGATINWFSSLDITTPIGTGSTFITDPITENNTIYFVQASLNGCVSDFAEVPIYMWIPPVLENQLVEKCENETLNISPTFTGYGYSWSTGESTLEIEISTSGTYTVDIDAGYCWLTQTIIVEEIQLPTNVDLQINEGVLSINLLNSNDFEFALNDSNFQDEPIFELNEGGIQTISIQNKRGCDVISFQIPYLKVPLYFTPNNDGNNDRWTAEGLEYFPNATIEIFDRFGGRLKILNGSNNYWDGIFNGFLKNETDYWFVIKNLDETGKIQRGHFSLLR